MKTEELFERCRQLAETVEPTGDTNRYMHETLVLCCAEGLRDTGQAYGNVFSQVDYLCKRSGISLSNKIAIQTMRRHSNSQAPLSREDLLYDVRALCLFVSAVFSVDIPDSLVRLIPTENRQREEGRGVDYRYIRCIVSRCDEHYIYADTEDGEVAIDYLYQEKGIDHTYLKQMVREGMQLNLLDVEDTKVPDPFVSLTVLRPRLIVVEPDFLVDISAIAACFTDYGHHPLLYTVNRLKERANTQPILLGNFADTALDDIINHEGSGLADSLPRSFREQALQYCTCEGFNAPDFRRDAQQRIDHLREAVALLFGKGDDGLRQSPVFDREKVILEPSFVCERLGLQGRVDLMTTDMRLLVEHKSGKNYNIDLRMNTQDADLRRQGTHGLQLESHYVQLLLYYGVLRYNFGVSDAKADIRLLYSKYPARQGLLVVNYYQQLFREAIKFRNQLVATEYYIAQHGFARILPHLSPAVIYAGQQKDTFFTRYIEPRLSALNLSISQSLNPLEQSYFCRMMTFVYREQLYAKVGSQEGKSSSIADLWNMPLHEKKETGNIYTDLTITARSKTDSQGGYDLLTLDVPAQGEDFLPNFRRGDTVCLYAYRDEPDIRQSILYKGTLQEIHTHQLVVRLNDGQQNPDIFAPQAGGRYAIEHGSSDASSNGNIRSLQTFITALPSRRALLLGQRTPEADTSLTLSQSYHPNYDDILLKALQAQDYFLLVGPPGTGKTSMALRFLVEEHLAHYSLFTIHYSLLLTAYTNRAVDEICGMLTDAGIGYIRISNESSCDPRFADHLLDRMIGEAPRLDAIRQLLLQTPVIVSTTSMLQSRPFIFQLKQFDLAIVDEASQILEPGLVGILSKVRKFILIGDYKQLPAVVQQSEVESAVSDEALRAIGLTDCRNSLFERLIRWEEHCGRSQFVGILRKQGRMHPAIAEFPNRMFYFREQLEPVPCEHQLDTSLHYDLPSEDALDDLLKTRRMLFLDSSGHQGEDAIHYSLSTIHSDKVNPSEAQIVADLLRRIHRFYGTRFDSDKTVGVIVPYRNQIAMIRKEIERLQIPALDRISIDTVERYQGSQRDVIIYSFTIRFGYQLDFLTSNCFVEDGRTIDRKLNVAITRARCQMLMTGHAPLLRQNPVFAALIQASKAY